MITVLPLREAIEKTINVTLELHQNKMSETEITNLRESILVDLCETYDLPYEKETKYKGGFIK